MSNDPGAILIAEIGSVTTRVTLIDLVEGEFRLIGQSEVLSSVDLPHNNALVAIIEGVAQIGESTGRTLLREDGQLLMPQNSERDGVDRFLAVSSATPLLSLVITAIASDVSARSALRASRSTYTSVLQVITLDDAARQQQGDGERSWIERQVQTLLGLQPDAVVIAGGLEGGAEDAINRLAHMVALTAIRPSVDASGQQRQDVLVRPVIYAGNSGARERVLEALSGRSKPMVVDNMRPSLEEERLEPVRRELARLYDEQSLSQLPGMATMRRMSGVPVRTVCAVHGLMTRFMAERYERHVLMLDVGAANSAAYLCSGGRFSPAVMGNCGVGYGLSTVLDQCGVAAIARWLPFSIAEDELHHWLLNKLLRSQIHPASREDALIEQAVAREVLRLVVQTLRDERPEILYDMVMLGGSTLAHAPHPGLAALTLLDALQPTIGGDSSPTSQAHAIAHQKITTATGADPQGAMLDLHMDSLGLMAATGALAPLNPDAAVTVFERDLLRNTPLATCVVALGNGKADEVALEAELVPTRGKTRKVTVLHGQIARLPLDQGSKAQLTLRPASGVRIGTNMPGVEVSSDVGAISGSALGVIIDARGRPLVLPTDDQQRRAALWGWLVALGVERGPSPYLAAGTDQPTAPQISVSTTSHAATAAPVAVSSAAPMATAAAPTPPQPSPAAAEASASPDIAAPRSRRISLDELAAQEATAAAPPITPTDPSDPAASAPKNLENDLAQLRQTVEVPQKKGWFGRKK